MKIGINGRFLLKPFTGIGQYTRNLLYEMSRQNPSDSFVVIVPEKLSGDFGKNVRVIVLPEKKLGMAGARKTWWEQIQLPERLLLEEVDLAFFPYPSNPWTKDWYARSDAKGGKGVKTVVTVHDCIPWKDKRYRRGMLSKMYHAQSKKAVKMADLVLTVSGTSMKEIIEVCKVPKDKIEVVYNDVDPTYKEYPEKKYKEEVLSRFGLRKEEYILYVGGYDERKNVGSLVKAWSKWQKFPLVLAGGKSVGGKLYGSFDAVMSGEIVKTGFLSNEELNVLYRECLFFVNLSEAEGFNLPILEAANCGAPMILSDIPVHREVAEDAAVFVKGDLVKAFDRMTDKASRGNLKQKEAKLARKYDWKKYASIIRKKLQYLVA